jgi:predicted nuclease of predicted toxin-antitoxin system
VTFKIDENLPLDAATLLGASGFGADTVRDQGLSGVDDEVVAGAAKRENRVLITLDLDFSNIRAYPPEAYSGIVVLRVRNQDKRTVLAALQRAIRVFSQQSPAGPLWIVGSDRIRYRQG